jgi:hypothetical protein
MELISEWEALAPANATAASAPALPGPVLISCLRGRLTQVARARAAVPHPPALLSQQGALRADNLDHLMYLNVFKHLFEHAIRKGLSKSKKNLMRDYLKAAGCNSYDAAKLKEEDSTHLPDS